MNEAHEREEKECVYSVGVPDPGGGAGKVPSSLPANPVPTQVHMNVRAPLFIAQAPVQLVPC